MSLENQKYFADKDAGGGPKKGPDKGKESLDIKQLQKDFEDLSKIEKIERQDIEPHLDKVLEILQNEPENIRPKDKKGRPGGLIELKKDIPTILIPDLHGRRDFLLKILNYQDEKGITNLEKLLKGEIQIVCLGDALHTEDVSDERHDDLRWEKAFQEQMESGKSVTPTMEEEIADSFGTIIMIMKLKELSPENFHYLRGNHDDTNETYKSFRKFAAESTMVKNFIKEKYGEDFLKKYAEFEENLPLLAHQNKFYASHAFPVDLHPEINIKPTIEKALNYKDERGNTYPDSVFNQFCWRRLRQEPESDQARDINANLKVRGIKYFYGHDYFDPLANVTSKKNLIATLALEGYLKVDPNGNYEQIKETKEQKPVPEKQPQQIEVEKEKQSSQQPEEEKKKKKEEEEKKEEKPEEKKEKKKEKKKKEEKEPSKEEKFKPQEIANHFKEEVEKIKDLPKNTELQRWVAYKECYKLIKDWLPFGNLDNFEGINSLMEIMEENRPKTMLTFNYQKEKLAQTIAYQMAFQYGAWKKTPKEKTSIILNFVNTWLKDKSFYYQMAENFKSYLLEPPEKYFEYGEKYGYAYGIKLEEPTKSDKWLVNEIATLLKLTGKKDKTLSQVSKILAMQGIPYTEGISKIANNIENQSIKRVTEVKLRDIEEQTQEVRAKMLVKEYQKYGVLPELPLKIKYYEKYANSLKDKLPPEQLELITNLSQEILEEFKENPNAKKIMKKIQQKAKEIKEKEKNIPKPEVVQKAKDFITKKSEKTEKEGIKKQKENWWKYIPEMGGYSIALILVLLVYLLIKGGEKITEGNFSKIKI